MKSKTLIWVNANAGFTAGLLFISEIVLLIAFGETFLANLPAFTVFNILFTLVKLGIIALGFLGHFYYRGSKVKNAAHLSFIIGGALSLIPWFGGLIGGAIVLIGTAIYLFGAFEFKDPTNH